MALHFFEKGFSEEDIAQIGEVADKYRIKNATINQHVSRLIDGGVPPRDVADLIEIREILRSKECVVYRATLSFDLTIGIYNRFGGEEGGVGGLRRYAEFVLYNEKLILSALPHEPHVSERRKIECVYALPIYELSDRDPEKAKETLESYVNSLYRT